MGTVRLATVVLMITAAPVFSVSLVSYEIQLGGNNHASSISACTRVAYTQGIATDNQTFYRSDPLNWAATVAVSGNHSQPGHPSDGLPTQGVANFVFNLELHQGAVDGPLATNVSYYSTIHDGTGGTGLECTNAPTCTYIDKRAKGGYILPCPTPPCTSFCAGAAFTYVFNINTLNWGFGTVLEPWSSTHYTGTFMEVGMYPTVDLNNTTGDGQLLGVGAGYGRWNRVSGQYSTRTTKGVGLVNDGSNGGLGTLPLVEGQIDVSQLDVGTYVLKLTPGTGHNVLRGDLNLVQDVGIQAFSVPANQVAGDPPGDTITFILTEPPPALALVSVKAVRTHGATEYGVPFFPDTNAVECRTGAVTKVVATFNQAVSCAGGTCDPADVTFTKSDPDSSVTGVSANGSELTLTLSGQDTNPDILTFSFPGIQDSLGRTVTDQPCIRVLAGDADSSGTTNQLDLVVVRGKKDQPVADTNFRNDVNVDGAIDGADLTAVDDQLLTSVGTCP